MDVTVNGHRPSGPPRPPLRLRPRWEVRSIGPGGTEYRLSYHDLEAHALDRVRWTRHAWPDDEIEVRRMYVTEPEILDLERFLDDSGGETIE